MILVDTSIWVDHLRSGNAALGGLLDRGAVLGHPWVTGELSLGNLGRQSEVIRLLQELPQAIVASEDEVQGFIVRESRPGSGFGYVDAQLLAATRLTPDARLWTGERRLSAVGAHLGIAFEPQRPW